MSIYVPPRMSSSPPPVATKAGPTGPGAGVLQTELPLTILANKRTPQARMRRAWELGISVPWIRAAERVIAGTASTVEWHLEDDEDVEVDDYYPDPQAQRARLLLEKPQSLLAVGRPLTRRELWAVTFRHMGLCGNAFWYLDQRDALAGTPDAFFYIRPDRMTPVTDEHGNLLAWALDRTPEYAGTRIELAEVVQFVLDPPDEGHFGIGLVESALLKAQNSTSIDQHLAAVLSAGGRVAGFLSPKTGDSLNDQQYNQLVADARTIVEQPDAAKRLQVTRGPIDFIPTTMTPDDLGIVELLSKARDDLLALWGVPPTQIGVATSQGLNGGDSKKYDEATLWQKAIHPRIVSFVETVQFQILDRWEALGIKLELEISEPSFDEEAPRYDWLSKSASTPLRNWERRDLIGLEPFGPDVLNPMTGLPIDDEVWLPINTQQAFVASDVEPDESIRVNDVEAEPNEEAAGAGALETADGAMKAAPAFVFGRPNPNYRKGPEQSAYQTTTNRAGMSQELANIEARARAKGLKPSREAILATYQRNLRRHVQAGIRARGRRKSGHRPSQRAVEHTYQRDLARNPVLRQLSNAQLPAKAAIRPNVAGLHTSLVALRTSIDERKTPYVKQSVASFLADQRREIASRARGMVEHLMAKPGDAKSWWDGPKWDRLLMAALQPVLIGMAEEVDASIGFALDRPRKAGPVGAVQNALTHGATRITAINARTRDAVIGIVRSTVAAGIADGKSPADVGDDLEAAIDSAALDNGTLAFDEYRAELIARTEMMAAYNDAALGSYRDADIAQVQAIDGDKDEECARRNGQLFSLDDAEQVADHPNGTLDWVPVIGEP